MKRVSLLIVIVSIIVISMCGCGDPCKKGHTWEDATCTKPKTCTVCNLEEGVRLGHEATEYKVVKEATCGEEGKQEGSCIRCGETLTKPIWMTNDHTEGEWKVTTEATETYEGTKTLLCSVCGKTIRTEKTPKVTFEQKVEKYASECAKYSYDEIARNPENYNGKKAHLTGKVVQVMEDGDDYALRVNITKGAYVWSDTIYVTYTKQNKTESRILEDDIVDLYGVLKGTYTYETVMGAEVTIPFMNAQYVVIR